MRETVTRVYKPSPTGAPGAAPVAGKLGLTMGIMGAPGAPGLHRDRREGKRRQLDSVSDIRRV